MFSLFGFFGLWYLNDFFLECILFCLFLCFWVVSGFFLLLNWFGSFFMVDLLLLFDIVLDFLWRVLLLLLLVVGLRGEGGVMLLFFFVFDFVVFWVLWWWWRVVWDLGDRGMKIIEWVVWGVLGMLLLGLLVLVWGVMMGDVGGE